MFLNSFKFFSKGVWSSESLIKLVSLKRAWLELTDFYYLL